ncbi:arca-like protein [Colletotrichum plurivorum]|uniref:Arca-like protein n=1 Tax=Colletotrichum plurivorum TaxID=2175906 RepID=A0A8H6N8N3_9PEZI|nr:arca-like protein [Colletotrichum plurivorum]
MQDASSTRRVQNMNRIQTRTNPCNPERGTGAARSEYNFADNQTWVRTSNRSFSFVDETEDVVNIHASVLVPASDTHYQGAPRQPASPPDYLALLSAPSSPGPDLASRNSGLTPRSTALASRTSNESLYGTERSRRPARPRMRRFTNSTTSEAVNNSPKLQTHVETPASSVHTAASSIVIPWDRLDLGSEISRDFPNIHLALEPIDANFDDALAPHDRTYVETPLWPLRDRQEAFLYRYFVDSLAPLFDLCDSNRHFARVVPKRAVYCPTLLNAMFAAASKRLSRTMGVDAVIADRYHQRCLRSLIPALSSSTAVVDDNLLAAVVILRFTEEVDIGSMTLESHLMGTRILLAAQANAADFSSLRLSAFWLALRQEIYMAFVHTRPVHPNFFPSIRRILERDVADDTGADCAYANRVISTCAACLSHCYGQENHHGKTYAELKQDLDDWWRQKPWYFEPMWANQDSGFLPEEQYITDAAVTGLQHYHLSRMLLIAHNPKVARLGTAFRAMEEELKQTVRIICGLAVANERTAPAYVNACISLAMAGDRFTDRKEQEELYRILLKTDRRLGWPTHAARAQLREAWGWEEDSPSPPSMPIAGMLNANARAREGATTTTTMSTE